ncbi:hypothetical protein B0H13DRAFT_2666113 [Mycena leptocephala]|nr:hypothetical protein B0H13DRAFT_2666113 [Mycena leptocephala]
MDPLQHLANISVFSSPLLPTSTQTDQLRELVRTNSSPPDPTPLRSLIASSGSDIARYETEIRALQEIVNRLISERDALREYIDGCRSVFSPVRRLPTEILAQIFALCAPAPVSYSDVFAPVPSDAFDRVAQSHLLRLSQVCIRWYETAMGTPWLWATIEVDLSRAQKIMDKIIQLLSRSLDRSANCSLTIHCFAGGEMAGPGLELLVGHSAKWRSVDIYLGPSTFHFLSPAKGSLPLLERLEIAGPDLHSLDVFESAPKLRHFESPEFRGRPPKLPWAQLHHIRYTCGTLYIDNDRIEDVLAIMRCFSRGCRVEILNLDLSYIELPIPAQSPVESNTRSLELSVTETYDPDHFRQAFGEILGALTFPFLEQLSLRAVGIHALLWPRHHFLACASRSSFHHTLTKLMFENIIISEDELVECLSDMPALLDLFLYDVPAMATDEEDHILVTDSLLRRLTWTSDPDCLTPYLSTLHLGSLFTFDHEVLLEFVTSRVVPGRADDNPFGIELINLQLGELGPEMKESVLARLLELVGRGELRFIMP